MEQSIHQWEGRYAALLSLFPGDFRKEYAPLSLQLFSDMLHDAYREKPEHAGTVISKLFLEAATDLIREQSKSIVNKLIGKKTSMKNNQTPFHIRNRMPLMIAGGAVIVLGVVSVLTGFWGYNGPVAYLQRVLQYGSQSELAAASTNQGLEDVAANFVNDYVQAKYYGDKRTDVGYASTHANKAGEDKQESLEAATKRLYSSVQPGFDLLTCSTQAPSSVHFSTGENGVVAAFKYPGSDNINRVTYRMRLDQSKSVHGDWKVTQVICTSLDEQANHPYVLTRDENVSPEYSNRNDRTYAPAQ